jgi:hypothetical protein
MATTIETIDLPLGDLVTTKEWGDKAFVYAPSEDEFYITQEKHKALEFASPKKFEAKVTSMDGKVKIVLPTDFARAYMWQRNAQISKIVYGTKLAIVVFAAPKQPIMVMGHKGQP